CVGDQELIQDIYKGNLEQAIKEKINQLENRKTTNEELRATIDANVYRFNHLIKPSNRGVDFAEKLQWQRKLIYIFKTLVEIEKRIDQNKPLQGIPNIALMAYVSKIDNEDQFYVSHAPRDYNPNIQYPVVIFATIRAASNLQYLESRKIADMDKLEILQYLADKYQMIVVQPWNREVARFNFNSIGETDLFEVLSSVKSNYNVDTTRIFITGTCEGGDKAIKFAVRYPHLFAGVGLVSPAFNINPFENEWHKKSLPFDNIENLANTPILNIHSESDSHNSIMNSLYLEQLANHSNLEHFSFIRLDNIMEDFYFYKYSEKIFEFFSGITPIEQANSSSLSISDLKYNTNHIITILERNNQGVSKVSLKLKNNKIHISSSNVKNYSLRLNRLSINRNKPIIVFDNGELLFEGPIPDNSIIVKKKIVDPNQVLKNNHVSGPLADIFTNRFIIVVGSIGTPEQTKINEINAQFFNDSWNEKYFSNCMIKYDYQIDESDIKTANLLLVGNFESNQILKNLDGEIPLSIKDDMIKIGNYTETGKNLNLYFIYPNPKNVNKYIGVFSGGTKQDKYATMIDISEYEYNSLLNMYGEDSLYFDISCFGWYDYKVWNDSGINLYSGYFNDSWQNDR
ncbi:MAG TPA: hypothetical protein VEP89_14515, partial [Draconibacterium sp.]|nr:hypothetical protein [Draconibacterium sp.]